MNATRTTASAQLVFRFASVTEAAALVAALEPENPPHCRMRHDGGTVVVDVHENGVGSVAASVDDLLACASAAVRSTAAAAHAGRDR